MTGMFQSSRIASGSPRLQISNAFSPSSASTIWKSSPSRIRLATLRMTLESSTTRHVLMFASASSKFEKWTFAFQLNLHFNALRPMSGRQPVRHDFKDAIDIEDGHELTVEAMHAAGELGHAGIEIDGVFLTATIVESEHLADLIDQQAIGFAAQVDTHRHRLLAVVVFGKPKPGAHVHQRDDAAAQIEHAGDLARRQRHPRQPLRHEHILNPRDRQPEQLPADHRGDVFGDSALGGFGLAGHALSFLMPPVAVRRFVPSAPRSGRAGRTWRRNRGSRPAGRARSPPATPSRTRR